jgi:hypothetical protein
MRLMAEAEQPGKRGSSCQPDPNSQQPHRLRRSESVTPRRIERTRSRKRRPGK